MLAECSHQFVYDIKTNQSTLYSGYNSGDFKSRLQLYNGKLFGGWAYMSYYNTIWWCNDSNLFMATYVLVTGAGIEYLFRLFLNQQELSSSSSSSSTRDEDFCRAGSKIDIVLGTARLSSQFIDGLIVVLLPNGTNKQPVVNEVSMNFVPFPNILNENIEVFDDSGDYNKNVLNRKMTEFIKTSLAQNLLPALELSVRKGLNKCLPKIQRLMNSFRVRGINNQTIQPNNRLQKLLTKFQNLNQNYTKRSIDSDINRVKYEMRAKVLTKQMDIFEKFGERAKQLLTQKLLQQD